MKYDDHVPAEPSNQNEDEEEDSIEEEEATEEESDVIHVEWAGFI
jgi:hypothetical protein